MTKLEKFLEGVEKLRTPENTKKIDALIEGTNLIAAEYHKRKLREEKARLEAEGFRKLDQHRIDSGLSTKAFIEGVGKTIIESSQPDDIKDKLMENLKLYAPGQVMRGNDNRNLQAFGEFAALCVFAEGRFHCGNNRFFTSSFAF